MTTKKCVVALVFLILILKLFGGFARTQSYAKPVIDYLTATRYLQLSVNTDFATFNSF
jgi:hypothetical protein